MSSASFSVASVTAAHAAAAAAGHRGLEHHCRQHPVDTGWEEVGEIIVDVSETNTVTRDVTQVRDDAYHWATDVRRTKVLLMLLPLVFFGRPFVERFAICYRTVVLSCLSVCNVGVLWPNGGMDQDETWRAGRPRPWPHFLRWRLSSPSPKGAQPSNFRLISVVAKRLDGSRCHLVRR